MAKSSTRKNVLPTGQGEKQGCTREGCKQRKRTKEVNHDNDSPQKKRSLGGGGQEMGGRKDKAPEKNAKAVGTPKRNNCAPLAKRSDVW